MTASLFNRKILVTRDALQAAAFIQKIETVGAQALLFPTVKIAGPQSWADCDRILKSVGRFDWIVFSNANGVRYFMDRAQNFGLRNLPLRIAVVGTKTAEALSQYNLKADLIPRKFTAAGLLQEFNRLNMKGQKVLWPTSNLGRSELPLGLKKLGAEVTTIEAYRTLPNDQLDAELMRRQIAAGELDALTFFSPSAFRFFVDLLGRDMLEIIRQTQTPVAVIGPTTQRAVEKAGLTVDILPSQSTEDDLLQVLIDYFARNK